MTDMRQIAAGHNRVRTVGDARAAVNTVLMLAAPYYASQSGMPFPRTFNDAYLAVRAHRRTLEAQSDTAPIDFSFGTPIRRDVERLYIELSGIQGFRERLRGISLTDELWTSTREFVSGIPHAGEGIGQILAGLLKPLFPMLIIVVIVIAFVRYRKAH